MDKLYGHYCTNQKNNCFLEKRTICVTCLIFEKNVRVRKWLWCHCQTPVSPHGVCITGGGKLLVLEGGFNSKNSHPRFPLKMAVQIQVWPEEIKGNDLGAGWGRQGMLMCIFLAKVLGKPTVTGLDFWINNTPKICFAPFQWYSKIWKIWPYQALMKSYKSLSCFPPFFWTHFHLFLHLIVLLLRKLPIMWLGVLQINVS